MHQQPCICRLWFGMYRKMEHHHLGDSLLSAGTTTQHHTASSVMTTRMHLVYKGRNVGDVLSQSNLISTCYKTTIQYRIFHHYIIK